MKLISMAGKAKKNTAGDFETMRRNQSIRPTVRTNLEADPLTNQIKDIDKIINLNMKIKQLENSGMKDMANEIREANGIQSPKESNASPTVSIPLPPLSVTNHNTNAITTIAMIAAITIHQV